MKNKKRGYGFVSFGILIATVAIMLASNVWAGAGQLQGSAILHAVDGSGRMAEILFLDDGKGIVTAVGDAADLPAFEGDDFEFISLLYNRDSLPGGPDACGATTHLGTLAPGT